MLLKITIKKKWDTVENEIVFALLGLFGIKWDYFVTPICGTCFLAPIFGTYFLAPKIGFLLNFDFWLQFCFPPEMYHF